MRIKNLASPKEVDDFSRSFDQAKRLFAEGNFEEARALSQGIDTALRAKACALRDLPWDHARASVVVVTYGDRPDFREALVRLSKSTVRSSCEFILVDNGSEHATEIWESIFPDAVILKVGFNYGCSGGRNVGAEIATGGTIVFIDDDGFVTPDCVEHLIHTLETNNAAGVRGRVLAKTLGSPVSTTYDLGLYPILAPITAEGVSAFARDEFLSVGGFDPLLAGHEGALVSTRLYRKYGPASLIYEPNGILFHDYSDSSARAAEKKKTQDRNNAYVAHQEPAYSAILASLRNVTQREFAIQGFLVRQRYANLTSRKPEVSTSDQVSIITTARNACAFIRPFYESLARQTTQSFELIFVDDGSTDDTANTVRGVFANDQRLKLIASPQVGRAEALNIALANASSEICVIADVDDVSLPYRLKASREILVTDQTVDCTSLLMFDDRTSYMLGRPHRSQVTDFFARALFGMPAPFPAFAFRRSRFKEPFDPSVTGGVDYDWLARNMLAHGVRGHIVPIHGTYYYRHEGQISATKQDQQRATALRWLKEFHRLLVPTMTTEDERLATTLAGWTQAGPKDIPALKGYAFRLASAAAASDGDLAQAIADAMFARVTEIELELMSARVTETEVALKKVTGVLPAALIAKPPVRGEKKATTGNWPEPPWQVLLEMLLKKVVRRLKRPPAKPKIAALPGMETAADTGAWPEPPWPVLVGMLFKKSKRKLKRFMALPFARRGS